MVESSLELFEEFSLDSLVSFESKLEQNYAFALQHPVGARIFEMLKNWNHFISFEDITYYHARILGEHQRPYHDSEMMKAPTNVSAHGRYNEVGRSCYYIASIDVQLRTSEHRSMYSYVRLSIDRCTATYV